jgi:hypothetical protein
MADGEPDERARNQAAYLRLRDFIDKTYRKNRFVGIYGGKIVADAPTFEKLDAKLNASGIHSREALVVQAGVDSTSFQCILSFFPRA